MAGIVSKITSLRFRRRKGNNDEVDAGQGGSAQIKIGDKGDVAQRTVKRTIASEAPSRNGVRVGGGFGGNRRGGRQDVPSANDQYFRERNTGREGNRNRGPDDGLRQDRHPDRVRDATNHRSNRGGVGRGRGNNRAPRDDRHSKTGIMEHEKQAALAWGGNSGDQEWADEKAGDAIAKEDEKAAEREANQPSTWNPDEAPPPADGENWGGNDQQEGAGPDQEAEPEEDKTKSYADYMAEQAEKRKEQIGGALQPRKPNEGKTRNKKFPEGKALARDEDDDFIAGTGGKTKRDRARKEKNLVELDDSRLRDQPREERSRSGRGGRGGSGRGDYGGDRGGRGRGRGGRGGHEGEYRGRGGRGGRGGSGYSPNVLDKNAFPSLGS